MNGRKAQRAQVVAVKNRPTVMVVDDEPDMLFLVAELVKTAISECDVKTAMSAVDALNQIREHPPSLMLTDYLMPGVDGLALAERIRTNGQSFPIILMTAFVDSGLEEKTRATGLVQSFFRKPLNPESLLNEIRRQLQRE